MRAAREVVSFGMSRNAPFISVNFQFKQLEGRSLKNIRASTGVEPVTSVMTSAVKYEFRVYFTSFHCTGRYEINKLTSLPMCGFTTQLVEHRTGIAEVTGSSPVEALIFFRLHPSNCLNWKFTAMITLTVQYEFHKYFTRLFFLIQPIRSLFSGVVVVLA